jgi:hypothetical protein
MLATSVIKPTIKAAEVEEEKSNKVGKAGVGKAGVGKAGAGRRNLNRNRTRPN